jgi:hypothetical protein
MDVEAALPMLVDMAPTDETIHQFQTAYRLRPDVTTEIYCRSDLAHQLHGLFLAVQIIEIVHYDAIIRQAQSSAAIQLNQPQ